MERLLIDIADYALANALTVCFADGSATERVEVEFPLGHPRRRAEGLPQLEQKLRVNLASRLPERQSQAVMDLFRDAGRLESLPVGQLMAMFTAASIVSPT
jgi:2-methylcitrate dehydratase